MGGQVLPQLGQLPNMYGHQMNTDDNELVTPERAKERAERQARRDVLRAARRRLMELPCDEWFEIPGRCAWSGGGERCAALSAPWSRPGPLLRRNTRSLQPECKALLDWQTCRRYAAL